jgi:hypothetical protein
VFDILEYRAPYRLQFIVEAVLETGFDEEAKKMQPVLAAGAAPPPWWEFLEIGQLEVRL